MSEPMDAVCRIARQLEDTMEAQISYNFRNTFSFPSRFRVKSLDTVLSECIPILDSNTPTYNKKQPTFQVTTENFRYTNKVAMLTLFFFFKKT